MFTPGPPIGLFKELAAMDADEQIPVKEPEMRRMERRKLAAFLWMPGLFAVLTLAAKLHGNTTVALVSVGLLFLALLVFAEWGNPIRPRDRR
jgi:hypothetical protein